MNEFIKKLIERLEEEYSQAEKDMGLADTYEEASRCGGRAAAYEKAQKIVNQVAEEYEAEKVVNLCNQICDKVDDILQKENVGIKTNADRIRAMSDEELAEFLVCAETHGYYDQSISGTLEMIDWLQSEVEG